MKIHNFSCRKTHMLKKQTNNPSKVLCMSPCKIGLYLSPTKRTPNCHSTEKCCATADWKLLRIHPDIHAHTNCQNVIYMEKTLKTFYKLNKSVHDTKVCMYCKRRNYFTVFVHGRKLHTNFYWMKDFPAHTNRTQLCALLLAFFSLVSHSMYLYPPSHPSKIIQNKFWFSIWK